MVKRDGNWHKLIKYHAYVNFLTRRGAAVEEYQEYYIGRRKNFFKNSIEEEKYLKEYLKEEEYLKKIS